MRMTIPALLAVLTLSVTMACGSSSDIKTPANQSYRFEGLTTVVTWEASREATHYIVYYDDFFGDNCRVDSRGLPVFASSWPGTSWEPATPTPAQAERTTTGWRPATVPDAQKSTIQIPRD